MPNPADLILKLTRGVGDVAEAEVLFEALVKAAVEQVSAMTPGERDTLHEAQRQSWARGEMAIAKAEREEGRQTRLIGGELGSCPHGPVCAESGADKSKPALPDHEGSLPWAYGFQPEYLELLSADPECLVDTSDMHRTAKELVRRLLPDIAAKAAELLAQIRQAHREGATVAVARTSSGVAGKPEWATARAIAVLRELVDAQSDYLDGPVTEPRWKAALNHRLAPHVEAEARAMLAEIGESDD